MPLKPENSTGRNGPADVVEVRLHVAGDAPNSVAAHANLIRVTEMHPGAAFEIEIVDCLMEPEKVLEDNVLVTPTLIRISPEPVVRIIGDLRDHEYVARALGLKG